MSHKGHDRSSGLQISVGHRTVAEQNLLMADQRLIVVGHNARTLFFTKTIVFFSQLGRRSFVCVCLYIYIYIATLLCTTKIVA